MNTVPGCLWLHVHMLCTRTWVMVHFKCRPYWATPFEFHIPLLSSAFSVVDLTNVKHREYVYGGGGKLLKIMLIHLKVTLPVFP